MTMRLKYTVLFFICLTMTAFTASARHKLPTNLTVMSYNIRNGESNDGINSWNYRYHLSAMMIDEQKPDIIGLQEALQYQKDYLVEYTKGYKAIGVGREDGKLRGKKSGEIMAVLYNKSKIKLIEWGTFWLSERPDKPSKGWDASYMRTATWALMKDRSSGKSFYFVNTHLDNDGALARKNGMRLILSWVDNLNINNLPVIICGDFNVEYGNECLSEINSKMKNAREFATRTDKGTTYNVWGHSSDVIDHIYFSGFSSCPVFEVINKPYGGRNFISDHYPVKAVLIF